jgi:predicted acyltransferase
MQRVWALATQEVDLELGGAAPRRTPSITMVAIVSLALPISLGIAAAGVLLCCYWLLLLLLPLLPRPPLIGGFNLKDSLKESPAAG